MKKSTLTVFSIMLAAIGLMAQSKKADTALKAKAEPYVLTHRDSLLIESARRRAQPEPQQLEDLLVPNNPRLVKPQFNDVIDVEHEIK